MTKVVVQEGKKKEFKVVTVTGIAMYASVHKPKKPYTDGDIPAYQVDLLLTDEEAAKLEAEGLVRAKVKIDEDTKKPKEYAEYPGLKVFALKRKTHRRGEAPGEFGEALKPLHVEDSQGNPLSPSIAVGNGSKVRVAVNPYTMNIKGRQITGHTMLGVQVLELVEYKTEKQALFSPVKGGFVAENKPEGIDKSSNVSNNEDKPLFE